LLVRPVTQTSLGFIPIEVETTPEKHPSKKHILYPTKINMDM